MGVPGNANTLLLASAAAGGGAYQISRSLRFNAADSAYLNRTPASAGNRKTWTWAGWVKRSALGTDQALFSAPQGGGYPNTGIVFNSSNQLRFFAADASINVFAERVTSAVYRDTSAWMHIVVAADYANTQAKIYVNGSEVTAFATSTGPTNTDGLINSSGTVHVIGQFSNVWYLNAYLADIHFIDGQALTPSSFTEVSATTGQLVPKAYTGTYGTNGFELNFSDNSTAAALGTDTSGNGNTWTVNNLSVTAGSGNDSLVDTPTSYGTDAGVGGEVRGNYCTFNPLKMSLNAPSLTNGNLDLAFGSGTATWRNVAGTFGLTSGKWYWEVTATVVGGSGQIVGIASAAYNFNKDTVGGGDYIGIDANSWGYYSNNGQIFTSNAGTAYGSTYATGDVIGVALDLDNGKVWFSKNGTYQNSGSPTGGTNAAATGLPVTGIFPAFSVHGTGGSTQTVNFGQRAFSYTAPANFRPLVDTLLPSPPVAKPNTVMDVALWTGNGSTQTISGLNFDSDFLWIKRRNSTNSHQLTDSVRGLTKYLFSDATLAEETRTDQVTATSSTGFNLGSNGAVNASASPYVGWAWDAGTSTVTNTAGSISSQVRANASAGFSVVTYTGVGSTGTIGHGLGVAPSFYIVKARTTTAANSWRVYHSALGNTKQLFLESTSAESTSSSAWNNTSPTSTVFSVGSLANESSGNYVAYCFAPVSGYSSFGSYVGNGSTDGPFVYTGFRPRWVMIKNSSVNSDSTYGSWKIIDTSRDSFNGGNPAALYANAAYAEGKRGNGGNDTYTERLDLLSNGFKLGASASYDIETNENGVTYIYAAFAESPFQYARAR